MTGLLLKYVEAIKDAIVHLSEPEREELAEWIDQMQEDEWDREMERDFSAGEVARAESLPHELEAARIVRPRLGMRLLQSRLHLRQNSRTRGGDVRGFRWVRPQVI